MQTCGGVLSTGAVSRPQLNDSYRSLGTSGFKVWHGPLYRSFSNFSVSSYSCLWALNRAASWGVRLWRYFSSLFNCSCSLSCKLSCICWFLCIVSAAKSFAPGGVTNVTGGYSPTLILKLSGGKSLGSCINAPCSSTRYPRLACQLYEWRKSSRTSAIWLERTCAPHMEPLSGPSNGWTETPSSIPSTGVGLLTFHLACS